MQKELKNKKTNNKKLNKNFDKQNDTLKINNKKSSENFDKQNDTTLKKNDELVVKIERLGVNGEGIATKNGKIIFVPFALVGEEVKIHIVNDKNSFLIAKKIEITGESDDRVVPPCPYFEKCGGCDIQHLKYSEQLKLKKNIVKDSLSKYAKIDFDVNETIESEKQFRYRNKFAFPVQCENGIVKVGMYKKNSHNIVEIEDCLLQSERVKTIIKLFKEYLTENKISAFDEKTHRGTVKHIVVRESGEDFILTVVVTDSKFKNFEPLIKKFSENFKSFGIFKNVNTLDNNVIFGDKDEHIFGLTELEKNEFDVSYKINNRSFLQVNDDVKKKIYKKILELAKNNEKIIDAYSGAGLLSSILAKNSKEVIGVEIIKEATENANYLKKINNLNNLTNINGDCSEVLPDIVLKENGNFLVVLDPPRKGVDKSVIDALLSSKPQKIIYLSCNPATLSRDVKFLSEIYDVTFVQPYDMFPQTANVETILLLEKKIDNQI